MVLVSKANVLAHVAVEAILVQHGDHHHAVFMRPSEWAKVEAGEAIEVEPGTLVINDMEDEG